MNHDTRPTSLIPRQPRITLTPYRIGWGWEVHGLESLRIYWGYALSLERAKRKAMGALRRDHERERRCEERAAAAIVIDVDGLPDSEQQP